MPIKEKLPKIKKDICSFLMSEEGRINKKSILKISLALILAGKFLEPQISHAGHFSNKGTTVHSSSPAPVPEGADHCQHGSHGSHGSHYNHSEGGWC